MPLRGNVDTRLRKLADEASSTRSCSRAPGCSGSGREREIGARARPGALRAGARARARSRSRGAPETSRVARRVARDRPTRDALACLLAERALARELGRRAATRRSAPTRRSPATARLRLRAWVGLPDGSAWVSDELRGRRADGPRRSGATVAARLQLARRRRAAAHGAREMAEPAERG